MSEGPRTTTALPAVLVGVNGWRRWKNHAAHFFVAGRHLCGTRHGLYDSFKPPPTAPAIATLTPSGLPYGKTCARCLRLTRKAS